MINRRFFLIGATTVVASAAMAKFIVPELLVPQTQFVSLPADSTAKHRKVFEVYMATESGVGHSVLTVKRPEHEHPLFHWGISNNGGIMRWVAAPDEELVLLPGQMLALDWPDCPPGGLLYVNYRDIYFDDYYQMFQQKFEFTAGLPHSGMGALPMMTERKRLWRPGDEFPDHITGNLDDFEGDEDEDQDLWDS